MLQRPIPRGRQPRSLELVRRWGNDCTWALSGIFRHAVFQQSRRLAQPHAPQEECERWLREGLVYGCAKPFRFDGVRVEVCGYE